MREEFTQKLRTPTEATDVDWVKISENNKEHKKDGNPDFSFGSHQTGIVFPFVNLKTVPLSPTQRFKILYDYHITNFDCYIFNGWIISDNKDIFIDARNAIVYIFKNMTIEKAYKLRDINDLYVCSYCNDGSGPNCLFCCNYRLLKKEYFDNLKWYDNIDYILPTQIFN